jgi:uncharacterized protein YkwD
MILLFSFEIMAEGTLNDKLLERHNTLRAEHGAPALKWNSDIEKFAQEWANKIAKEDSMYHRNPNDYGENIHWISGAEPTGESVTNSWYNEINYYDFSKPGFSMKTGHFTQVVWVGSTEIGCGQAKSKRGGIYIVCNYNPPGNYSGQFPKNVLKKK